MASTRDNRVDWVRAICSFTIILAHVGAPAMVNQIRSFDVVALVFLSGMSMQYGRQTRYCLYIKKRAQKLLLPTYVMMIFVFSMSGLLCWFMRMQQLYSANQIIRSFFLLSDGSMGYVWIVRVYLMIAVCSPVLWLCADWARSWKKGLSAAVACLSLGLLAYFAGKLIPDNILRTIYMDYIYNTIVYCIIAVAGMWFAVNKQRARKMMIGTLAVFAVYQCLHSINGGGFEPGDYKYPPQLYYCIYGIAITTILYCLVPSNNNKIITWISANSFMIYLWHIVMLRVYGVLAKIVKPIEKNWIFEYAVVTSGAIFLTWIWKYASARLRGKLK